MKFVNGGSSDLYFLLEYIHCISLGITSVICLDFGIGVRRDENEK